MVRLDEGGRAATDVRIFAPAPALRPWIRHASIQPGPARHAPWRVVPDTSPHVIFSVAGALPALLRDDAVILTDRSVDVVDAMGSRAAPCADDLRRISRDARALLGEPPSTWFRRGADSFTPRR